MTLKQLRQLKKKLHPRLGEEYWKAEVFTAKQCEEIGTYDPPCAFAHFSNHLCSFDVCVDEEVHWDHEYLELSRIRTIDGKVDDIMKWLGQPAVVR